MREQLSLLPVKCSECGLAEPHIPFASCLNPPDYAAWSKDRDIARIYVVDKPDSQGRQHLRLVWWHDRVIPRGQVFHVRLRDLRADMERAGFRVEVRDA